MLRTRLYVAISVLIFAVHSSQAANCTSTSFDQAVTAAQLALSLINGTQYASSTTDQLNSMFSNDLGESAAGINYTIQKTGDAVTFSYTITFACNATITTALPDGTQQTTEVKSKLNTTAVGECISAGLTDRTNHISLTAEQVKAGLIDATTEFNTGGPSYFEWTIHTTKSSYLNASTASSFKNATEFPTALANFIRTRLSSIYQKKISNVTFISLTTANTQYALKFRLYFVDRITPDSSRTKIITNIQTTIYQAIRNYFPSILKTTKIPTSSSISAPTPVVLKSTRRISLLLNNIANSVLSVSDKSPSVLGGVSNAIGNAIQDLRAALPVPPPSKSGKPDNSESHSGERGKAGHKANSGEKNKKSGSSGAGSHARPAPLGGVSNAIGNAIQGLRAALPVPPPSKSGKPDNSASHSGERGKAGHNANSGEKNKKSGSSGAGSHARPAPLGGVLNGIGNAIKGLPAALPVPPPSKPGKPDNSASHSGERGPTTHSGYTTQKGATTHSGNTTKKGATTRSADTTKKGVTTLSRGTTTKGATTYSGNSTKKSETTQSADATEKGASTKAGSGAGAMLGDGQLSKSGKAGNLTSRLGEGVKAAATTHSADITKKGPTTHSADTTKKGASTKARSVGVSTKPGKLDDAATKPGEIGKADGNVKSVKTQKQGGSGSARSGVRGNVRGGRSSESWESDDSESCSGEVGEAGWNGKSGKAEYQGGSGSARSGVRGNVRGGRSSESWESDDSESCSGEGDIGGDSMKSGESEERRRSYGSEVGGRKGKIIPRTTASPEIQDGLYGAQSRPLSSRSDVATVGEAINQPSSSNEGNAVGAVVAKGEINKKENNILTEKLKTRIGQSEGQSYIVTGEESNRIRDLTINSIPMDYDTRNVASGYSRLLYNLGHGRQFRQPSIPKKPHTHNCAPQDIYVSYVYEYDMHNQVFNSSFQDPDSIVIKTLQSDVARFAAEELYKRNLVPYVTDEAHLTKIMDVSKQYNDQATLRFYISIDVSKSLIPVIRHVLQTVLTKLKNERFATSNKKIDWGEMVLIPITK
ncbi:unnamed protein product [Rotaria socialis]|uniref:Uncharacterized protein n=2 Tax=Rotaria socialis TaxID=392032 RepID=A0A817TM57_9BILA|nr:unnamed protein product [Rotaria socialis]